MLQKFSVFLLLAVLLLALSGCGFHSGLTTNQNTSQTTVELSEANFEVVKKVSGNASASYILGIGGTSKVALIERAQADMLAETELVGTSRALINQTVEVHLANILGPIYNEKTVVVSAYVVEFQDE